MKNRFDNIIRRLNKLLEKGPRLAKRRNEYSPGCNGNIMFVVDDSLRQHVNETIENWASQNNVNLVTITSDGRELRAVPCESRYNKFMSCCWQTHILVPTMEQIDNLDKPNTVLYLKDIDKMADIVYRRILFDFINNTMMPDERECNGVKIMRNVLFAIATCGKMPKKEFRVMTVNDAKDCFCFEKVEQTEAEKILSKYNYSWDGIVERIQNASFTNEQENADIINSIVLWKINRQVTIDNALIMNIRNFSKKLTSIKDIIGNNGNKDELKKLLTEMLKCHGIRIAMASTILKMFNPNVFPIIDQRAYRAVSVLLSVWPNVFPINDQQAYRDATQNDLKVGNVDKDVENYIDYIGQVEKCRKKNCPKIEFSKMDAFLYQIDIENGNPAYGYGSKKSQN